MATINNLTLSIVKNVANAEITVDYDVTFTPFEQLTNVEFDEVRKLIGDDTGEDGDDGPVGDDSIALGWIAVGTLASNGQASVHRTKTKTIAWTNLNENTLPPPADDDEIRAVVTLTASPAGWCGRVSSRRSAGRSRGRVG